MTRSRLVTVVNHAADGGRSTNSKAHPAVVREAVGTANKLEANHVLSAELPFASIAAEARVDARAIRVGPTGADRGAPIEVACPASRTVSQLAEPASVSEFQAALVVGIEVPTCSWRCILEEGGLNVDVRANIVSWDDVVNWVALNNSRLHCLTRAHDTRCGEHSGGGYSTANNLF